MSFVGMPVVVVKGSRSLIDRMKMEDGDRQKCPAIGVHMYHLDRPLRIFVNDDRVGGYSRFVECGLG